ncbi:hypothetical protein [Paenibacillus sp. GCM10028914]|uniref:hypothetical protein n=1 Tax=Paenibacillus sp. GCM10028914 TaxID=3273416 RepID=UPI003611B273
MKKIIVFLMMIILVSGCGENNTEKATQYLLKNQRNDVTVVVFTNKSLEDSFIESLQKNIDYINNDLKIDKPITNVSFINIREDQTYNYQKIYDLVDFPQITLFEKDEIVLETTDSDELVNYYKE